MTDGEDHDHTAVRRDRFSGGPARDFLSSMDADDRIFEADLAVDRAHVVMLAEQGIVEGDEAAQILEALVAVEDAGFDALSDGEDVHEAIETAVIEHAGDVGGKMHTARSRNDEVATCIRYRLRADLLDAAAAVIELREVLAGVAAEEAATVMPGFTHLQPAQPTTVAHHLLSYEGQLARDTARLLDAYARTNRSPLGGAAFAGTPFDVDRQRTADLLGFDGVVENSMDAASSRDVLFESVAALAGVGLTLSGIAEDLVVFANRGFVALSDDYSSTSSIMPQKKNPDTMELVRASAGQAAGALQGLLTTLKGLPRAYNRDLQQATGYGWTAVDAVVDATEVAAGAVATADWPEDVLLEAAGDGFSTATGVADLLAMHGLPFRTAHELVARAAENGSDYDALDAAAQDVLGESIAAVVSRATIEAALDPAQSVASRNSLGGPAPEAVRVALDDVQMGVTEDAETVESAREALGAAADSLDAEVSAYV
jgi:argininosuccinate lyase